MKMIKKISIAALGLASLNASASITYNKHELVKNINQIIKKVQHLSLYQAPESCKWHVRNTHSHVYKARKYVFEDDVLNLKHHLTMADKSLEDLKYESEECEEIKIKSKKYSNMLHKVLNQIEHQNT
tara:strand:+ start:102 stop:482 length:381 start_codon:yes stop_codon:yes gene_type:complete